MSKTGIAEWRGEGRGNADEEQGEENAAGWEGRGCFLALGRREEEIDEARDGSERGLDSVQHQGVGESLSRGLWFGGGCGANGVGGGGDRLLQDTPREALIY